MKCDICGIDYELRNKHGGGPKIRKTCGSNSCQAKWQYRLKTDWFRARARKQYWNEKKSDYEKLRKRNYKAKSRQRFGVESRKEFIKQRGSSCQNCGDSTKRLLIHHIDNQGRKVQNFGEKPNNLPENLMVLCYACHTRHHRYGLELKMKT
jgi:hypothetical protein